MFKLESYITPIILSYVDKYIKNFRPEDSQLSLWGGEASFINLDLRLEVLEQELQLPFTFVSGHIHELLIHVPWTKITSEPITITINTIECTLKLKDSSSSTNNEPAQATDKFKKPNKRQEMEAPPGYIQSLINKIVNNMKIYCNNLIVKYVEDDIVFSMNIKLLTFESANAMWQSGYIDVSQNKITLRKLIKVVDLTICLDKRNSSGKIIYQEPVLYRCSLTVYLLRYYYSTTSKRPITTCLDIYCDKLEFGATETQIPMLLRIIHLINALASKELKPNSGKRDSTAGPGDSEDNSILEKQDNQESWASWAWSFIPSLTSMDEEDDDNQLNYSGHIMQIGVYVDYISVTFKVPELQIDRGYYTQNRIKYMPLLSFCMQGVFVNTIVHEVKWSHTSFGISEILLFPVGFCSCSYAECQEGLATPEYFKVGSPSQLYKKNSLFDPEVVENNGNRSIYSNLEWDDHLITINEEVLLERTPAFAIDMINQIDIPDDISSELLLELSNNRENSNFPERSMSRIVFGPFILKLCSGFLHRLNSFIEASSSYDYSPYCVPKPDPLFSELLPPSADDYTALNENIPMKVMRITLVAPIVQMQLQDHPFFIPEKKIYKRRKLPAEKHWPYLTLQCEWIDVTIENPIYEKKLVVTTCQLPEPPQKMLDACYKFISGKILGFQSKLVVDVKKHTILVPPCYAALTYKSILKPKYWINSNAIHETLLVESENFSVTGTKCKLMVAHLIIDSFLYWKVEREQNVKSITNTSLLKDTVKENGTIYAEFSFENIRFKKVLTKTTNTFNFSIDTIKGFVFEEIEIKSTDKTLLNVNASSAPRKVRFTDIQQVMFLSAPEYEILDEKLEDPKKPFLSFIVQFPVSFDDQNHTSVCFFDIQEMTACFDPLFLKWFCYCPKIIKAKPEAITEKSIKKHKTVSDTSSNLENQRKVNTPHESVHSSSDREHLRTETSVPKDSEEQHIEENSNEIIDIIKRWSGIWSCCLVSGLAKQCTIYAPVTSLSTVGSQNIKQAVQKILKSNSSSDLLVLITPEIKLRSSVNYETLSKYVNVLPVIIPSSLYKEGKTSFPWYVSVENFSCYSLLGTRKFYIIKKLSFDSTLSFSIKSRPSNQTSAIVKDSEVETSRCFRKSQLDDVTDLTNTSPPIVDCEDNKSMNICIHFDIKPVVACFSEAQVCLIANIFYGLFDKLTWWFEPSSDIKVPEVISYVSEASTDSPILLESSLDSQSDQAISFDKIENVQSSTDWTIWIQWTMTRITVEFLAYDSNDLFSEDISYALPPNIKLVFDFEDIVTSFDYQGVFFKVKNKIATANILHFRRSGKLKSWKPGPALGIIMKERETNVEKNKGTSDIFSMTITRANSKHTHALWGAKPKNNSSKLKSNELPKSNNDLRFINEIDVNVLPVDFILPSSVLRDFFMVLEPFFKASQEVSSLTNANNNILMNINNQNLPLFFLRAKGIRIVLPYTELGDKNIQDVCIFQVEDVILSPRAENPIIRTPCRPDIYQQGARMRKLNVPGSDIEDRQYQLDILGISSGTCLWKHLLTIFDMNSKEDCHLKTMSENPALEWNKLGKNVLSPMQQFIFWPIFKKFNVSLIFAPAMVYKEETIICGHSFELNFVSDLEITISVHQINFLWNLFNEFCVKKTFMMFDLDDKRPQVNILGKKTVRKTEVSSDTSDQLRDSGIEVYEKRRNLSPFTFDKDSSEIFSKSDQDKKTYDRSSGIVVRSSSQIQKKYISVDVLIVGGKITFSMYDISKGKEQTSKTGTVKDAEFEKDYEGSEEGSDNNDSSTNNFVPLAFIYLFQPNFFSSFQNLTKKIQISVSNVKFKSSCETFGPIQNVPIEENYPINFLETKAGLPHSDTGVLPAFLIIKWNKSLGKMPTLDIEFGKPFKIEMSLEQLTHFLVIYDKMSNIFCYNMNSTDVNNEKEELLEEKILNKEIYSEDLNVAKKKPNYFVKLVNLKKNMYGITCVNLKVSQVVLVMKTASGSDGIFSIGFFKSFFTIGNRPERITNMVTFENVALNLVHNKKVLTLLNPCTVSAEFCFFWEPWQHFKSNPQMQISVDSDNVHFETSARHLNYLNNVLKDLHSIQTALRNNKIWINDDVESKSISESIKSTSTEKEQHYMDDLRAGAFQFVNAVTNSSDELPLPYQVMFWDKNIAAMAWRYPQPRVLTKVCVFPVPFKEASEKFKEEQVLCSLEYWTECDCSYQPYTQFFLSESEMCYVDLPKNKSYPTVACIWRVVLHPVNYKCSTDFEELNSNKFLISPKALAACLRIDSYFSKNLVPDVTLSANLECISLSLFSHYDKDSNYKVSNMLKNYTFDENIPEDQCFAVITVENCKMFALSRNFENHQVDMTFSVKCFALEYSFLTLQTLVEPFLLKVELDLTKNTTMSVISQPIIFKYGPSIGHTLAVNLQMWSQAASTLNTKDLVILTNYVVCNDTYLNIVFGQADTSEKIPLSTRCFHFYCWRTPRANQMLRMSAENFDWEWSDPFKLIEESTKIVNIGNNYQFFVTVKNLSATQKQVIIRGNLLLSNMLSENFEFKVFEHDENDKDKYKKAKTHILERNITAPSLLLKRDRKYCLRLRFFGIDSSWTGNIPLEINPRNAQPWLVKVPLQERNSFLSIWCKIITQKFGKSLKYLAVLSPLYMVKSNLAIKAKCKVETLALMQCSNIEINGKGNYQQLYCPGTCDQSHLLSFYFDNGLPAFNSVVPLNYTVVDQKKFFKNYENEDINEVLKVIDNFDKEKWPFFGDDLDNIPWFVENQSLTHVNVNYREVCRYSSCLLIELTPWCILTNNLGCTISIIIDKEEACTVRHQGIVSPPKMEGDFYISISMGKKKFVSQALQLTNSEWSQAFYMPKIIGTVPLNGFMQTPIKCGAYICMVSIMSKIHKKMRQLRINSSHVLINSTEFQLQVVCFAVPDNENVYNFPENAEKYSFIIAPNLHKSGTGVSVIRWYLVDGDVVNSDFALYISFAINSKLGWSCPVRVDKGSLRRAISVKSEEQNIPLVITCQDDKGLTYVSVHVDKYPQMQIENMSGTKLYFVQYMKDDSNGSKSFTLDAPHFDWAISADVGETIYYSLPSFSEKFPELTNNHEKVKFSIAIHNKGSAISNRWSVPINTNIYSEQFVKIPDFKDVKVTIFNSAHTNFITIDSINQAEFSAKDIRRRLVLHEIQNRSETTKNSRRLSGEMSNSTEKSSMLLSDHKEFPKTDSVYPSTSKNSKFSNFKQNSFSIKMFLKGITLTLTSDLDDLSFEVKELVNIICDDIALVLEEKQILRTFVKVREIQIDNQMYARGGYDFPVVLISQSPQKSNKLFTFNKTVDKLITEYSEDVFITVELILEKWNNPIFKEKRTHLQKLKISLKPLSAYIEDAFILKLKEYFMSCISSKLVLWTPPIKALNYHTSDFIHLPGHIVMESVVLANPISIRSLVVDQWSLLLSVHSSIKIYIALDQSPLHFSKFEHTNILTTPYRLGYGFTLHYLSGAIFGAGWVVGSLELLGSPGTLARAMGSGLKDFVSLPYLGLIQGPWAFIRGITNGSASLMIHVTAGTVQSVTKLAASVARNLDRLTLDDEHLKITEEFRRNRPHGVTQGFLQGLTGFGISLLGAVGGIAHHPLKSIMQEGASPKGLATGVGLGIVGVFTKPLSGAADLIAQTGEGFLQGAGWNVFPEPRIRPVLQHVFSSSNSVLKYAWKFSQSFSSSTVFFATDASNLTENGVYQSLALILLTDVLLVINIDTDSVENTLNLKDLEIMEDTYDPTLVNFKSLPPKRPLNISEDDVLEMDPAQRARVANYVKNTIGLLQIPDNTSNDSEMSVSSCDSAIKINNETKEECRLLSFFVNPRCRNYFVKLFNLAKERQENYSFQFN